ncbi:galanin receptor type 1-like isoform X2 [Crassostrea virginica]
MANLTERVMSMAANFNVHVSCDAGEHHDYFPPGFTVFIITWLVLIFLADVVGNSLVVTVILKNPSMRDPNETTNYFLLNLAVADLLVALVIPFSIHSALRECWDLELYWCKINSFLVTLSLLTSIHTLVSISLHKFISVRRVAVKNEFNRPVSPRTCYILISVVWAYALVFSIFTIMTDPIFKEKTLQCGPRYPVFGQKSFWLHVGNQCLNLLCPLVILIFCYSKIFIYIRQHAKTQRRISTTPSESSTSQGERGVTLTLVIVLACFVFCWLPYIVYTNLGAFVEDKKNGIPFYLNPVAYCCGYMNSACNPLIYAWRIPRFRQGYKDIIGKTRYLVTIDQRSSRGSEEGSSELLRLSVNGHKSDEVTRSRPQTERLTSIEEKRGENTPDRQ